MLDPVTASKIRVIKGEDSFNAYSDDKWSCDPAMYAWLRAARRLPAKPTSLPAAALCEALDDGTTRATIARKTASSGSSMPRTHPGGSAPSSSDSECPPCPS